MEKAFIDTAFWIAFLNKRDQFHKEAAEYFNVALEIYKLQTSTFVIHETITFINCSLKNHQLAVDFLNKIEETKMLGQLNMLNVTERIQKEASILFKEIEDKDLSFTDCTSFTLMKKERMVKAMTFDVHFEQMGFVMEP